MNYVSKSKIEHLFQLVSQSIYAIYIVLFSFMLMFVIGISSYIGLYSSVDQFWLNFLIEAHGILLEILLLGIFMLWITNRIETNREIKFVIEQINELRFYSDEVTSQRIQYLVKRLLNLGISMINLSNCCLKEAEFTTLSLEKSDFYSADLSQSNLSFSNFAYARFSRAILTCAGMISSSFANAEFIGANLGNALCMFGDFYNALFMEANLEKANLSFADLRECDFRDASFTDAIFYGSDLRNAKNLNVYELCSCKTLYRAKLAEDLQREIMQLKPDLLKKMELPK